MSRKPLIAGNWKMNLNHFEAIALVQKIAFSLPEKYFDKVDVTVIPPFTDLRSVQTLVDGDKLKLTYGAQDVSQHDSGAYTGEISGAFLAKLGCTFAVVGHSERRTYHARGRRAGRRKGRRGAQARAHADRVHRRRPGDPRGRRPRHPQRDQLKGSLAGLVGRADRHESSSPTNRCGRSAPAGWPAPPTRRRSAPPSARNSASWRRLPSPHASGCSTADRSTPRTSGSSIAQADVDGALVGGASLDAEQFAHPVRDRRRRAASLTPQL